MRGTFLGSYRVRQQMAACRQWPGGDRRPDSARPVVSDVASLLFSGDLDPVTPVRFGDEVARSLRNGKHIVLKGNGHALGSAAPCIATIMRAVHRRRKRAAAKHRLRGLIRLAAVRQKRTRIPN